ncbi:MAG TPA: hypothetical protein VMV93_06085 [Chloroflexota bacterium]|nr:hypothetical protein [Chloroflexota bacterium]
MLSVGGIACLDPVRQLGPIENSKVPASCPRTATIQWLVATVVAFDRATTLLVG